MKENDKSFRFKLYPVEISDESKAIPYIRDDEALNSFTFFELPKSPHQ
jgi:hypothetical protein